MAAKYPDYADHIADWVKGWSVMDVGKVEWDHTVNGERYAGYMLVALTEDSALVRRDTREIVWSAPKTPAPTGTMTRTGVDGANNPAP